MNTLDRPTPCRRVLGVLFDALRGVHLSAAQPIEHACAHFGHPHGFPCFDGPGYDRAHAPDPGVTRARRLAPSTSRPEGIHVDSRIVAIV
jgi:hypothetical protein